LDIYAERECVNPLPGCRQNQNRIANQRKKSKSLEILILDVEKYWSEWGHIVLLKLE
jgi:hypothetical protein